MGNVVKDKAKAAASMVAGRLVRPATQDREPTGALSGAKPSTPWKQKLLADCNRHFVAQDVCKQMEHTYAHATCDCSTAIVGHQPCAVCMHVRVLLPCMLLDAHYCVGQDDATCFKWAVF